MSVSGFLMVELSEVEANTSFTGYHTTVCDRDDRPTHAELERKLSDPINYKIYTATLESEETMCVVIWVQVRL